MEKDEFFAAVCEATQEIPPGRVTTYGHIAKLIGRPECPRQVGMALKKLPNNSSGRRFNEQTVPWQRVINSKGMISPRGVDGASRQATALRSEGVSIDQNAMNEYSIDLNEYGWFPDHLSFDNEEEEQEQDQDPS